MSGDSKIEAAPGGRAQFRAALIDVLIHHQRFDIKGCACGEWGSDHGHLGQSHAVHVADTAMGRLWPVEAEKGNT